MRTIIITLLLIFTGGLSVRSAEQPLASSVYVLCYHAFLEDKKVYNFSLEELREHIDFFKSRGYRFVTFSDIIKNNIRGTKNLLVTVDDGNRTVYEAYYSVFKKNNIKPVLAIYPSIIGKKDYALTWEMLQKLSNEGCEIAAHGYYHQILTRALYERDPRLFKREIFKSKEVLEKKLGRKIDLFVYPFGARSEITIKTLNAAGYKYAFTINNGPIHAVNIDDKYSLPRFMITRESKAGYFNVIVKNPRKDKKNGKILALNSKKKSVQGNSVYNEGLLLPADGNRIRKDLDTSEIKNSSVSNTQEEGQDNKNEKNTGHSAFRDPSSFYSYAGAGLEDIHKNADNLKKFYIPVPQKIKKTFDDLVLITYRSYSHFISSVQERVNGVLRKIESGVENQKNRLSDLSK